MDRNQDQLDRHINDHPELISSAYGEEAEGGDDGFNLGVEEAAALLGVGRTRLSQLTSKGVFSFERRKIGIRNRLFYRKNEILDYIAQHQGRVPRNPLANVDPRRLAEELSPHLLSHLEPPLEDHADEDVLPPPVPAPVLLTAPRRPTGGASPAGLKSAREVHESASHAALSEDTRTLVLRLAEVAHGLEQRIQHLHLLLRHLEQRVAALPATPLASAIPPATAPQPEKSRAVPQWRECRARKPRAKAVLLRRKHP